MGEYARWKCHKDRVTIVADEGEEVGAEEREFFEALGDLAVELEKKDRSAAEERFFDAIGFIRHRSTK